MKIICAGFWKTGTKSLAAALRRLGYVVYDYDDQFRLTDLWTKFFEGTVTDEEIRKGLEGVDVIIDGMAIGLWEEVSRVFPDAKVILTSRDEESWWKSFRLSQEGMPTFQKYCLFAMIATPSGNVIVRGMIRLIDFVLGVEGPFSLPVISFKRRKERLYKFKFRQHNSHVLHTVPEEKLLVFPVGSGWEPLCKFLSTDVPDEPFPRKNVKNAHFKDEGGALQRPALKRVLIEMSVVMGFFCAILVYLVYWTFSYLFR